MAHMPGTAPMTEMTGWIAPLVHVLENIAVIIDLIGVAIILYGFVVSLIAFLGGEARRLRSGGSILACHKVRLELGTYILLGIEFMIASDIIHTVLSRELNDLIFVAALVAIRTAISFFLGRELAEARHDAREDGEGAKS
jgi:uncharacterized membrane protein